MLNDMHLVSFANPVPMELMDTPLTLLYLLSYTFTTDLGSDEQSTSLFCARMLNLIMWLPISLPQPIDQSKAVLSSAAAPFQTDLKASS